MRRVSQGARDAVLEVLVQFYPEWVRASTIARVIPYSKQHVRAVLKELYAEGMVQGEQGEHHGGVGYVNIWRKEPTA